MFNLWHIKKKNLKKPGGTSFAQKHLENICKSDEQAHTQSAAVSKLILGANL